MKKICLKLLHLSLIIMIVLMSGCGTFRKVFKLKERSSSSSSVVVKKDSTGLVVDKSLITVKEKVDTTIAVPGKQVEQETFLNMDSLVNGMTAIKNDLIDVRLHLDPVSGILTAAAFIKPSKIPVQLDRTTTKQNDITSSSSVSTKSDEKKKAAASSDHVEKEPVSLWYFVGGFGLIIFVILAVRYWLRRSTRFS